MSLEVPYERMSLNQKKVEYIPLKLAVNDIDENGYRKPKQKANDDSDDNDNTINKSQTSPLLLANDFGNTNYVAYANAAQGGILNVVLMALLSIFCVLVILYAIYYFVIIREREKRIVKPPYFILA
nr:orf71 [Trichoplusia ni single nucleopolyhedrovirus]